MVQKVKKFEKTVLNKEVVSKQDRSHEGISIPAYFCPPDVEDPFETTTWDERTASIQGEAGESVFEQKDCEMPTEWSQLATDVVVSKYFFGEMGTGERETSIRQLIGRVAKTLAQWGWEDGYFATEEDRDRFFRELAWLCLHQYGAFNSPVWFNVGLNAEYGIDGCKSGYHWSREKRQVVESDCAYTNPQVSACFIQSVKDTMKGIMELATSEAMLFKYGSGTGTDLTALRSFREKLAGGGQPSGPLSFMQVYDRIAAVVKSGGKTRRAAKMQSLNISHPDVLEFIEAKILEEAKAQALIRQGYDASFNGEAYSSVFFQNANLSVRVTDDFMRAVENDGEWTTRWVTDPTKEGPTYRARHLLERIADGTWRCGDPGLQYHTTINRWHTSSVSGPINASNPCSEYMFLDDSACNLASLNLMKFRTKDGGFDVDRFRRAVNIFIMAQEIMVDRGGYPTPGIAKNSHDYRPLGLGFTNLGAMLMSSGIPYDSKKGRTFCSLVSAVMTGQAYLTSSEVASRLGAFPGYTDNRNAMLGVMNQHRNALEDINEPAWREMHQSAKQVWDAAIVQGMEHGFRNAQATVLAPTGTISFMMDCDTTGIEPDLALVKYKKLAGGGMLKIVNQSVPMALQSLGYNEPTVERIWKYIEENGTIEGCEELNEEHLPVFDCAVSTQNSKRSISWRAHLKMMAAAQPFISGAISKTVNMPHESTVEDIAQAYIEGWKLGLKALAIYRDGSKGSQPLSTSKDEESEGNESTGNESTGTDAKQGNNGPRPHRKHLPDTRASLTHKFSLNSHEGYITVGLYENGKPGELFITMAKEGSTIGGLMDVLGTVVSMCLQYGVPLDVLVDKFSHSRFEPSGWTQNPDIPMAKSLVDYIFRWLGIQFIPGFREQNTPNRNGQATKEGTAEAENRENGSFDELKPEEIAKGQQDAPLCDNCGALTVRVGMCHLCYNCGNTSGCG